MALLGTRHAKRLVDGRPCAPDTCRPELVRLSKPASRKSQSTHIETNQARGPQQGEAYKPHAMPINALSGMHGSRSVRQKRAEVGHTSLGAATAEAMLASLAIMLLADPSPVLSMQGPTQHRLPDCSASDHVEQCRQKPAIHPCLPAASSRMQPTDGGCDRPEDCTSCAAALDSHSKTVGTKRNASAMLLDNACMSTPWSTDLHHNPEAAFMPSGPATLVIGNDGRTTMDGPTATSSTQV